MSFEGNVGDVLKNFKETNGPWSIRFGLPTGKSTARAMQQKHIGGGAIQFLLQICQCSWRPLHIPDRPSTESGVQCCRCYEFLQLWVSIQTPSRSSYNNSGHDVPPPWTTAAMSVNLPLAMQDSFGGGVHRPVQMKHWPRHREDLAILVRNKCILTGVVVAS